MVALAFVAFGAGTPFYQTLAMLVAACVVRFLPEAISSTRAALLQISPRLEEAARGLGRSQLGAVASVTVPLARPGILAGAALVLLTAMKELPATLLLSPTGWDTLAVEVWTAANDAAYGEAAAPALILIAAAAVPMLLLAPATASRERRHDRERGGAPGPREPETTSSDGATPGPARARARETLRRRRGAAWHRPRRRAGRVSGPARTQRLRQDDGAAAHRRLRAAPRRHDRDRRRPRLRRDASGGRWVPPEGRRVGMVFQDYALFPHLSVARNVAFGLPRNAANREAPGGVGAGDGRAGRLGERTPDQLSGGQQQRVALARALAPEPEVILLDEPFSNLDADLRASVREEVRQILREAGMTAVLVTHDQEEALSIADRVAVMLDGQDRPGRPAGRALSPTRERDDRRLHRRRAVVPGEASGRRAKTVLGEIPLHGTFEGPVDVMLRPEMLRLAPAAAPERHEARRRTIVSRAFFGHDQLLTLQLDSGQMLKARLGAYGGFRPGDRVLVSVRGGALAYPHEQ